MIDSERRLIGAILEDIGGGVRPFEDMRDARLDRTQELDRQEPAFLRVPVDGGIQFRRSLGALASAQSHWSCAANFALICAKCSSASTSFVSPPT